MRACQSSLPCTVACTLQETLEVFVEGTGSSGGGGNSSTADDSSKVRDMFRSLKPSRIRSKFARDNDVHPEIGLEELSDTDAESDAASEALDGQVFTVGVAFAQVGLAAAPWGPELVPAGQQQV